MKVKLIAILVRMACDEIGREWRYQQAAPKRDHINLQGAP